MFKHPIRLVEPIILDFADDDESNFVGEPDIIDMIDQNTSYENISIQLWENIEQYNPVLPVDIIEILIPIDVFGGSVREPLLDTRPEEEVRGGDASSSASKPKKHKKRKKKKKSIRRDPGFKGPGF